MRLENVRQITVSQLKKLIYISRSVFIIYSKVMEKIGTGEFSDEEENWNDTSWSESTVIEANTITQNRPIVTKPEQATSSHNARYNKFCLTLNSGIFGGIF